MNNRTARNIHPHQPSLPSAPVAATRPSHTAVRIDIETLQLHGFNAAQQQRFLQALERQLVQQAPAKADWETLASRHIAQLAPLQVRAGTTPERAASLLAQRLFGACTRNDTEKHHG